MNRPALFGMTIDELTDVAEKTALPSYAPGQLAKWLYGKEIREIDEMSDLSKKSRVALKEQFSLGLYPHTSLSESKDGTKKYLFPAGNSHFIEAAWIPEVNRGTLCISTQVGCKMGCEFCMTGKQGFQGNLTAGEILNQVKKLPERNLLTNIVYMGMGEPLDNLEEVLKSVTILTSSWGFGISPRRITVSTIGIIPAMIRFINECEAHLAISMHTPFDEERKKIMPVEKVHPIKEVINTLKKFNWQGQRRISMEYIMLKGFNDTPAHVNELSRLLRGLNCRMNLIRYHPVPGVKLEGTPEREMEDFRDKLNAHNIIATIRKSRGQDIDAACGLLSTKNLHRDSMNERKVSN